MSKITPLMMAEIRKKLAAQQQQVLGVTTVVTPSAQAPATSSATSSTAPSLGVPIATTTTTAPTAPTGNVTFGSAVTYNAEQSQFVELAGSGNSAVLIGPAGTGKTTCMRGVVSNLIASGTAGVMTQTDHPQLVAGSPGIIVCSFTRRAVANIRKQMPAELKRNCLTIHKLLEFAPMEVSVYDPETGKERISKPFKPYRNEENPLPTCISTIIVEESSMVGGSPHKQEDYLLFNQLVAALSHKVQFIFLGDIQQLPPVFGPAILGFKMLELPTVELTQVYRQALESPIIRLAHRILSGKPIPANEFEIMEVPDQLRIQKWKKKLSDEVAIRTLAGFFAKEYDDGKYNPEEDVILCPFNKSVGTLELNKYIATHIAHKQGREVYEIVAGFENVYLSVGDRVLIDREEAIITSIKKNPQYFGKPYRAASKTMNYHGYDSEGGHLEDADGSGDVDIDAMLATMADGDSDFYKRAGSHIIKYRRLDSEFDLEITGAGDINAILLAYAITVHKSQGSEWNKVYLVLHHTHASMINRELLYTAVTRARVNLHIICEPDTFIRGITRQKIPGRTWKEKATYFQGKVKASSLLFKKSASSTSTSAVDDILEGEEV